MAYRNAYMESFRHKWRVFNPFRVKKRPEQCLSRPDSSESRIEIILLLLRRPLLRQ